MVASLYQYGYSQDNFIIKKDEAMANEFLTMACLNKNKTNQVKSFCDKYAVKVTNK
jgi:hypothetical protein